MRDYLLAVLSLLLPLVAAACDDRDAATAPASRPTTAPATQPAGADGESVRTVGGYNSSRVDKAKWGDFELVLELPKARFDSKKAIQVRLLMRNTGRATIRLDGILPMRNSANPPWLDIEGPESRLIRLYEAGIPRAVHNDKAIVIDPNETVVLIDADLRTLSGTVQDGDGEPHYEKVLAPFFGDGEYTIRGGFHPTPQIYWSSTPRARFGIGAATTRPAVRDASPQAAQPADIESLRDTLAKKVSGRWESDLHNAFPQCLRVLRGQFKSGDGKTLAVYVVFPFGRDNVEQQRVLWKAYEHARGARIIGWSRRFTAVETTADPTSAAAHATAIIRALDLSPLAWRDEKSQRLAGLSSQERVRQLGPPTSQANAESPDGVVGHFYKNLRPGAILVIRELVRPPSVCDAYWADSDSAGLALYNPPPPGVTTQPAAGEAVDGLKCSLTIKQAALQVGDEIRVEAEFRNVSAKPISFPYPPDYVTRLLEFQDANGRAVKNAMTGITEGWMVNKPYRTLGPAETFKATFVGKIVFRSKRTGWGPPVGGEPVAPEPRHTLTIDFRHDSMSFDLVNPGRFTVALRLVSDARSIAELERVKAESPWKGTLSSNVAAFQVAVATREELDVAIATVKSGKVEQRSQAIRLLAAHMDTKASAALLEVLLKAPGEELRDEVAAALQAIGDPSVGKTVLAEYRKAGSPPQRRRLLSVMESNSDWTQQWELYLDIAKSGLIQDERDHAFDRLIILGRPEVVQVLIAEANNSEPIRQRAAIDRISSLLELTAYRHVPQFRDPKRIPPPETAARLTDEMLGL